MIILAMVLLMLEQAKKSEADDKKIKKICFQSSVRK